MIKHTSANYEKYLCNIDDAIAATLIARRIYNWMNNPKLNPEMSKKGYSVSVVSTFDNNYMVMTSNKERIDLASFETVKVLLKTYFEILLPFTPDTVITFKDKSFMEPK